MTVADDWATLGHGRARQRWRDIVSIRSTQVAPAVSAALAVGGYAFAISLLVVGFSNGFLAAT